MLILKGGSCKSVVVRDMCCNKNNFLFCISDPGYLYCDVEYVDTNEYNAHNCKEWIKLIEEVNDEVTNAGVRYSFFIIYTNIPEDDLGELIQWIEENKKNLQCMQVLLTCK